MLAPMCLSRRERALRYAAISLAGSIVGMTIAYAIGHYALDLAMPWLERLGYAAKFHDIEKQAIEHGFWLLFIAGFTPVPFKIFTLAAGAVHMPLLQFFAGAIIGAASACSSSRVRIQLGGARAETALHKWIEPIGWFALLLLASVVGWLAWRGMHG